MSRKKALITGITGQDGSYLAEHLLSLDYEVHGIVRRVALESPHQHLWRLQGCLDKLNLHAGSLESYPSLFHLVQQLKPAECYHLAAQSFVSYAFEDEFSTMNTNLNGTHYLLSAIRHAAPSCRFYFAGSSEMFGKVKSSPQTEDTSFHPRSVYGISKVAGFDLTRNYREAYNLFTCCGILFNHESPRRGREFVTRKITSTAALIKKGKAKELRLGNLDAKRDWGHARDYVEAMHLLLQQDSPDDFVIGTGKSHSVRDFLEISFSAIGLNYQDYVVVDEKFFRPAEVEILLADPKKARESLGWEAKTSFHSLVNEMIESDMEKINE